MLDDRTAANHELDGLGHYLWTNRANVTGWRAYLGAEPGEAEAPRYAVPARRTDLTGLPPAWIGVGSIDLFFGEDQRYAEALRAAGVPVQFDVTPGGPHGFDSLPRRIPVVREFTDRAESWLLTELSPAAR